MPPILLRPADSERDNAALCALARRCPLGDRLSFYHERDDFRERGRLQPHVEVHVAEEAGIVVGSASVARKPLWIGGALQPTAYVFDVMVDPICRGRGVARRLLRAVPDAPLVYAHVLDDNLPSRRLFESEGFRAHRRRILFHALLPSLEGRPCGAVAGPAPVDATVAADSDALLRERHDFVDATAGHDGLFHLEGPDGRAWALLRRHEPKVAVGVPWHLRALARLLPFIPRPGRRVFTWSLHHLGAEGRRRGRALDRLLRAAAWAAARQRVDLLLVPLFDDDPLNAVLRRYLLPRWRPSAGTTRLYVRGPRAGTLLDASRPLLLSGRDG
ncbi:MAG TPA: GNAT family N-acetyltransferase [Gemmataceae bacterium]|nr:GNAT family N-acetyltransferase [Gemmataceae bacterium]